MNGSLVDQLLDLTSLAIRWLLVLSHPADVARIHDEDVWPTYPKKKREQQVLLHTDGMTRRDRQNAQRQSTQPEPKYLGYQKRLLGRGGRSEDNIAYRQRPTRGLPGSYAEELRQSPICAWLTTSRSVRVYPGAEAL